MKVLNISTYEYGHGGAFTATRRIHKALLEEGVFSRLLVLKKETTDPTVYTGHNSVKNKIRQKVTPTMDRKIGDIFSKNRMDSFSIGYIGAFTSEYLKMIKSFDIICLYWIVAGFCSIKQIGNIIRQNKPIIWRLSDMWPFTGGCHYSGNCDRYKLKCGRCPLISSKMEYDITYWNIARKMKYWKDSSMVIVSPSQWMAKCASKSAIFRNQRIEVIKTGTEETIFKPLPKMYSREVHNLPKDKKLLLFGAYQAISSKRKGFQFIKSMLVHLKNKGLSENLSVVIMGVSDHPDGKLEDIDLHVAGILKDITSLSTLYNACDLFIAPAMSDNMPNTVIEAMSCGKPCVAFDVGGMKDLIEHKKNGYLAKPYDTEDLANGVEWILDNEDNYKELCKKARQKIENHHKIEDIAKKYIKLYKDISLKKY